MLFVTTFGLLGLSALAAAVLPDAPQNNAHPCAAPPSMWCSSEAFKQACNATAACAACPTTSAKWCSDPTEGSKCGATQQCAAYKRAYNNKLVEVTLLYESRCPYCYQFINNALTPFFSAFQGTLANVQLVPYGNARRGQSGEINCQHGSRECAFNKMESCTLDKYPASTKKGFGLATCLEDTAMSQSSTATPEDTVTKCATKFSVSSADVSAFIACYRGEKGNQLQQAAADFTDAIWPEKHQWVPWIMFNQVSTKKLQDDLYSLVKMVCEFYVSDEIPGPCKQHYEMLEAANSGRTLRLPPY